MSDELDIPAFLKREGDPEAAQRRAARVRRREREIPYPRDGYLGKGLRAAARERLRAARRRHAERCRIRKR
jgi:hypothetical protein